MARMQLAKFTTPAGRAVYPHLTEADTKFDSDGVFHTKLSIPNAECEQLVNMLEDIRDAFITERLAEMTPAQRKKDKATVADVCEEELDDEGNETGNLVFAFKLKAKVTTKAGKCWDQQPRLFDAKAKPIEGDIKLWGGSTIKISGEVMPYYMASTKQIGVSLRCKAVQVIELVSGGGSSAEDYGFGEEDGYESPANENPFAGGDADEDEEEF